MFQAKENKFRPLTIDQVKVGGFFGPFIDTISHETVKELLDRCAASGMRDQIDPDRPNPGLKIPFDSESFQVSPQMFWDSDWGKAIEVAAYALYNEPNAKLEAYVDDVIDAYGRLQGDDGYLNSWYQRIQPGKRWTNLRDCHELYNAGHLIEGAVAYYYASGKRKFLDIMIKYADYIDTIFGSGEGQIAGYPGHPEIELALVKLARATGEQRYMDLAKFFIDARGQEPHYYDAEAKKRHEDPADYHFKDYQYCQAHKPVREQKKVTGHAVRAAYLYAGMADIASEYEDKSLQAALKTLWEHLTNKNLYITGGFGPSHFNEGMTFDYDLPNETAYAETCAAVSLVFWSYRMLGTESNRIYADVMERALYNGALSGISFEGTHFFYENPLESRGDHNRWKWHRCPCCPPNIARLLTSVGTYFYGINKDSFTVHLYCSNEAKFLINSTKIHFSEKTNYPYDGRIFMEVNPEQPVEFTLQLRIPTWAKSFDVKINGEDINVSDEDLKKGYLYLKRLWQPDDQVMLDLELEVKKIYSHPKVIHNQGRIALQRGALIYCLESVDNGKLLNSLITKTSTDFSVAANKALLDAPQISFQGYREIVKENDLYRQNKPQYQEVILHAVPYFAWNNRGAGEMLVWIREEG